MSGSADDTRVGGHGLRASLLLGEVQGEMSHRDEVEWNASQAALPIDAGVPDLDVIFRSFGEVQHLRRSRSRTLSRKVHSCLHNVAGSATIIATTTDAVLSERRVAVRGKQTDGASTIHGALELGQVVGTRKGLLSAGGAKLAGGLSVDVGVEEARTTERSLLHHRRVAELLDESLTTLDGGIGNLSSLVGAISSPAATLDVVDESDHAVDVGEVDEGVADVAS